MSNIGNYDEIMAFHPGYYVSEMIEDMDITQAEFAIRMGTTAKTVSQLVNGQIALSNDLAQQLATMFGMSIDFWLNLQKSYDEKMMEIKQAEKIGEQKEIVTLIDYGYFVKMASLPKTSKLEEKIKNLCGYLNVSDLRAFLNHDFLVNFRTGTSKVQEKNILNARIWLQTALNIGREMNVAEFNATKLKQALPTIREMTIEKPDQFIPHLKELFSECGVAFVLLPYLKNSGINGAVKWIGSNRVVLAMNNRNLYADTFWFSLFHEIKHVLQQKVKKVFVNSSVEDLQEMDKRLESEADDFATDFLIPREKYQKFAANKYISDSDIKEFAQEIGIHPGIVVGRLQHEERIKPYFCVELKEKYEIRDNELLIN